MTTEASIARRTARLAEKIGAGDGADGVFLIVRGSGMRGLAEARERMRALRDGTAFKPEGNGMRAYRAEVERVKAQIAERLANEPSEPEPPITPLPRPSPAPNANAATRDLAAPGATPISCSRADAESRTEVHAEVRA